MYILKIVFLGCALLFSGAAVASYAAPEGNGHVGDTATSTSPEGNGHAGIA